MHFVVTVRLLLPRETDEQIVAVRPFDMVASDVDVLLELKPEGKVRSFIHISDTDPFYDMIRMRLW